MEFYSHFTEYHRIPLECCGISWNFIIISVNFFNLFGFHRISLEFHWTSSIFIRNSWNFTKSREKGGHPRCGVKNVLNSYRNSIDSRCPSWLRRPKVHWVSWNFVKIHKKYQNPVRFSINSSFVEMLTLRRRAPQNHWNS